MPSGPHDLRVYLRCRSALRNVYVFCDGSRVRVVFNSQRRSWTDDFTFVFYAMSKDNHLQRSPLLSDVRQFENMLEKTVPGNGIFDYIVPGNDAVLWDLDKATVTAALPVFLQVNRSLRALGLTILHGQRYVAQMTSIEARGAFGDFKELCDWLRLGRSMGFVYRHAENMNIVLRSCLEHGKVRMDAIAIYKTLINYCDSDGGFFQGSITLHAKDKVVEIRVADFLPCLEADPIFFLTDLAENYFQDHRHPCPKVFVDVIRNVCEAEFV